MENLRDYAPWLLVASGVLGMLGPLLASRMGRGLAALRRLLRPGEPPASGEAAVAAERRVFVDAVLTAMTACDRSGCRGGVEAAKGLLDFVDRIVPCGTGKAQCSEVKS